MTNTKKAMKKLLAAISELVTAIESMDTLEKVQSDYYFINSMGDDLSNCEKSLDKLRALAWDKIAPLTIDEKGYEEGFSPIVEVTICIWADDTWCLKDCLTETLQGGKSDDYVEVNVPYTLIDALERRCYISIREGSLYDYVIDNYVF